LGDSLLTVLVSAQSAAAAAQLCAMLRTRSLAVWLLTGVIALVGMISGLRAANHFKPKPSYQGKALEYWFNELPMTTIIGADFNVRQYGRVRLQSPSGAVRTYGGWMEGPEASVSAIRAIGTNSLGFYLRKLTRHIGPIESRIYKSARDIGFRGFLGWEDVDWVRGQAVTALILSKPLPPEVTFELMILSTNRNQEVAAAAHCALMTKVNELPMLKSPERKESIDAELLKIRIPSDF
jgi:hypothetical protein